MDSDLRHPPVTAGEMLDVVTNGKNIAFSRLFRENADV